ncbi:MAG: LysM peptidoglycan-binding domain-containing protein [Bacteroidales bacterium]|nr:LysM peptidoglycan-binding domain-containing protein [Bacteroidales bacterium]
MNRKIIPILAASLLLAAANLTVSAQGYVAPPVTVSKEKVRSGGKVFYSHVVQERQTLYSISKAYGVTIEEIYESNPTLNLETEGLKKNQILMIPVKDIPQEENAKEIVEETVQAVTEEVKAAVDGQPQADDYFIHKVKWFEDMDAIARKYGVSKEAIININGMTSDKVKRKQDLKIPRHPEVWEGRSVTPQPDIEKGQEVIVAEFPDTVAVEEEKDEGGILDDLFVREGKHDVDITMLLPFSSPRSGDKVSFMDFYCGALLAARKMGNEGTSIDLHTYDMAQSSLPVNHAGLSESDFTIGPVSRTDIMKVSSVSDGATWIVSPLDMQVESLADSLSHLVQAPTPTAVQIKDMVRWIRSDYKSGDKVIVITPSGQKSSYADQVEKELEESGLPHSTTTLGSASSHMVSGGTNRFILACDYTDRSTVFLIEAVRNLYMMASRRPGIILYSTSRIRTYDQIDVEQLHKLNMHTSVTYFVDYDSKDVKDFLLQYRALFKAEPSRSAYSGYDLMKYFSTLAAKYGKRWHRALDRVDFTGLQSDFKLERTPSGSFVNTAVRRVIYNQDYSVSLVR